VCYLLELHTHMMIAYVSQLLAIIWMRDIKRAEDAFSIAISELTYHEYSIVMTDTSTAPPDNATFLAIERHLSLDNQPRGGPLVTADLLDQDLEHEKANLWIFAIPGPYKVTDGATHGFGYTTARRVAQIANNHRGDWVAWDYNLDPVKQRQRDIIKECNAHPSWFEKFEELEGDIPIPDRNLCGSSSNCKLTTDTRYHDTHMEANDDIVNIAMGRWDEEYKESKKREEEEMKRKEEEGKSS
jgi:hypothetical protein